MINSIFLVLEVIINHSLGTSLTHVGLSLSDDMLKGVFFFSDTACALHRFFQGSTSPQRENPW